MTGSFSLLFLEELFENVADSLHDFLMISRLRVSRMKRPINSIFLDIERLRWLSRQLGMPRAGGDGQWSVVIGEDEDAARSKV